jgi:hypothetical protein
VIIEVTPEQFKEKYREHTAEKQRFLMIEPDADSPEFSYVALFENGHARPTKEWEDQTEEEVRKLILQNGKATHYRIVDELDRYLIQYANDTEFIAEFQDVCTKIVADHMNLDKVKAQLAELVGLYRLSERSGYRLADMYNAEITSPDYSQDGRESE